MSPRLTPPLSLPCSAAIGWQQSDLLYQCPFINEAESQMTPSWLKGLPPPFSQPSRGRTLYQGTYRTAML
ncbi:hypothetical protein CgunFtcFv8_004924 [Champsocephalus gunnari]|uniref:Uncharacterized protein n=1 Tax=Champsocephalus gunnari TaxID=52237 RepID=A0AAN8HC76_CHAGU|nr:hypothetical protein CgunFtcFv8_004924 [Champsocephalus gunnari]